MQNCDNTRKKMKNAKVRPSSMKSFKTVQKNINISKKETVANQAALHNVQLIRNLPNILRNSNATTSRNRKLLNKFDTLFASSAEDGNTCSELNTTASSIDLDIEANYNKTASPKLHHQRKQVHNPLDIQYDISDCNNNKNENILPKDDQLNALHVSPSCEENASTKKTKYNNKRKKHSLNKKSKKITVYKSDSKTQMSCKMPETLDAVPGVNMKNTIVMQSANNILENDILTQSIYNPNFPNINGTNSHDIATKLIEPPNIFYRNNEIRCQENVYNVKKKYDVNLNHVISCKPTEFNTIQHKLIQGDTLRSYGFSITENNLQESIDKDIGSNFLYKPKILYSCSCANCMSHDKDIIFYEDPISTSSTSSDDMEAELFMCDLYTNINDFYIDNYFHIFDDNLMDFEEKNLYFEKFGQNNIAEENACTKSTAKLSESSANMSIDQNKSQNLQPHHIDKIQDCIGSYPTEFVTYQNGTVRLENVRVFGDKDISNYLNSENFSMKEDKIISQDKTLIQTTISTDVSVSDSKCQTLENKKGK